MTSKQKHHNKPCYESLYQLSVAAQKNENKQSMHMYVNTLEKKVKLFGTITSSGVRSGENFLFGVLGAGGIGSVRSTSISSPPSC